MEEKNEDGLTSDNSALIAILKEQIIMKRQQIKSLKQAIQQYEIMRESLKIIQLKNSLASSHIKNLEPKIKEYCSPISEKFVEKSETMVKSFDESLVFIRDLIPKIYVEITNINNKISQLTQEIRQLQEQVYNLGGGTV